MQTWSKCTADIFYSNGTSSLIDDAGYIVRLDEDILEIAYDDDEGAVCYRGKNTGDGHFELTWRPDINDRQPLPTSCIAESAGQPSLAATGGAGQHQILVLVDPLARRQLRHQRFVELATVAIANVLDTGLR